MKAEKKKTEQEQDYLIIIKLFLTISYPTLTMNLIIIMQTQTPHCLL